MVRRWLGVDRIHTEESEKATEEITAELVSARGEFRQALQRLDSGTRLMKNWAIANGMLRE